LSARIGLAERQPSGHPSAYVVHHRFCAGRRPAFSQICLPSTYFTPHSLLPRVKKVKQSHTHTHVFTQIAQERKETMLNLPNHSHITATILLIYDNTSLSLPITPITSHSNPASFQTPLPKPASPSSAHPTLSSTKSPPPTQPVRPSTTCPLSLTPCLQVRL
jgi:hypothetical protein